MVYNTKEQKLCEVKQLMQIYYSRIRRSQEIRKCQMELKKRSNQTYFNGSIRKW